MHIGTAFWAFYAPASLSIRGLAPAFGVWRGRSFAPNMTTLNLGTQVLEPWNLYLHLPSLGSKALPIESEATIFITDKNRHDASTAGQKSVFPAGPHHPETTHSCQLRLPASVQTR